MELDRIYNSDCISGMKNLPDDCVDLIVTDPPYLIRYKSGTRKDRSHKFCKEILGDRDYDLIEEYIRQCYRVLKPNSAMYMFCGSQTLPFFQTTAINAGFNYKNTIIWDKKATNKGDLKASFSHQYEPILLLNKGRCKINGKRINDIWAFPRVPSCRQVHQNQKPTALIEQCINKHSQVGGVILDGFMGSGTTAVACINTNRHYIGWELDVEYYQVAIERIANCNLLQK